MPLSELTFGSFLAYSPRGTDVAAVESRDWMRNLKEDKRVLTRHILTTQLIADRMRARLDSDASSLKSILTSDAVLVPVPRSSFPELDKPISPDHLWVPHRLAHALVAVGLGAEVWPCLRRKLVIRKASTSPPEDRPSFEEQWASLSVQSGTYPAGLDIVLIDDIVTTGTVLLAAADRLVERFPAIRISAFAAMRSISDPKDFREIGEPVLGRVRRSGTAVRRRP